MGTRQGKSQQLKDAELKLKAAGKQDQLDMRNPDSPLKSAKARDQSSANKMNAAVQKDLKNQEKEGAAGTETENSETEAKSEDIDLNDLNTTEELEPIVEKLAADIKAEEDEKAEKKRLADEMEEEIELRAETRYQEKMKTRLNQEVVTVPAANDPNSHPECCLKLTEAIEGINRLKSGIKSPHEQDVKIWLGMLTEVKKSAKAVSKAPPTITKPTGRRNWAGFDVVCGDGDRENRIYKNEFIGSCMLLIETSENLPSAWLGQNWIGYTKGILKQLQSD